MSEIENFTPIIFAGIPATNAYGGIDFVTSAFAATIHPRPNVTPANMVARVPTQTSSSITTSADLSLI